MRTPRGFMFTIAVLVSAAVGLGVALMTGGNPGIYGTLGMISYILTVIALNLTRSLWVGKGAAVLRFGSLFSILLGALLIYPAFVFNAPAVVGIPLIVYLLATAATFLVQPQSNRSR